jgi:hypothetical protein
MTDRVNAVFARAQVGEGSSRLVSATLHRQYVNGIHGHIKEETL